MSWVGDFWQVHTLVIFGSSTNSRVSSRPIPSAASRPAGKKTAAKLVVTEELALGAIECDPPMGLQPSPPLQWLTAPPSSKSESFKRPPLSWDANVHPGAFRDRLNAGSTCVETVEATIPGHREQNKLQRRLQQMPAALLEA